MQAIAFRRSLFWALAFMTTILIQAVIVQPISATAGGDARAWVSGAVWDGEGSTNNFSEAANWEGDIVPSSGDAISLNTTGMGSGGTFNVDLNTEGGNVSAFDYIRLGGTGSGTFTLTGDALELASGIDNDGDLYNYQIFAVENDITLTGNSDSRAGA